MKPHSIHPDFVRDRLSPHFVYESYDPERRLFFNRGSIGFVLQGWPLVGTHLHAQSELTDFLKEEDNLPAGATLQILLAGSSSIAPLLQHWASYRTAPTFAALAKKRIETLQTVAKEQGCIKDLVLFIAITLPTLNHGSDQIADLEKKREVLKATYHNIGLFLEEVDDQTLIGFLRSWFGWDNASHPELSSFEPLSAQILPFDFFLRELPHRLELNETHSIITLEPTKRPKEWALPLMDGFIGDEMRRFEQIHSDFLLSFCLQIHPHQALEKSQDIAKRETLAKSLQAGLSKWMPDLEEEYRDRNAYILSLDQGRIAILFQNMILQDPIEQSKSRLFEYRALMRRQGFHFTPCTHNHLAVMMAAFPMQTVECSPSFFPKPFSSKKIVGLIPTLYHLGHGMKTTSNEARVLQPIVGEWKGDLRSPGMLLVGRRGQLMMWSPFGPALIPQQGSFSSSNENFNLCLAGVPGSGKSVFMQELMLSTLGVGGKVFVLDYGRSFKRTCQLLRGQYIEFDLRRPLSLNPFTHIPEKESDAEDREDLLNGIAATLSTMAAPKTGTSDLQNAALQKALRTVWRQKQSQAEISDIADYLTAHPKRYAQELGDMLYPFTREGLYGRFFAGKATINLNSDIVVIETDHLRSSPALLTVIVQMVIVHINQTMVHSDRNQPFLILIDEAWKLLQGKESGAFIEEATRIARKYRGSITLATQQLTDYFRPESPAAEKAFENSSSKVILKQNPEMLHALRHHPKLQSFVQEEWQLNRLQSIHSNPPHYSEAALYGHNVQGVIARLMLDPFTLLLTSTNAEDYQALEDLMQRGQSAEQAISSLLLTKGISK